MYFSFLSYLCTVDMNLDRDFILKAGKLFIENGAKTLTMDDVARDFGVSKKTLYQMYRNKEALLEEVLTYQLEEIIDRMKQLNASARNAVERLLCRDADFDQAIQSNKSILIRQLAKYYPAIFQKHMTRFSEKITELMVQNIEIGREQGYYHYGFEADLYARLFFQLLIAYDSGLAGDLADFDRHEYNTAVLQFYINAITTEKGKEVLKKYNF